MLLDERVFYIDRDGPRPSGPAPVQAPTIGNEIDTVLDVRQPESRDAFGWDVILNKLSVTQVTGDFLRQRQEIEDEAARSVAIHEARKAIRNDAVSTSPIEQLVPMGTYINMGSNLEMMRNHFNDPSNGRTVGEGDSQSQGRGKKDNKQYYIPCSGAA